MTGGLLYCASTQSRFLQRKAKEKNCDPRARVAMRKSKARRQPMTISSSDTCRSTDFKEDAPPSMAMFFKSSKDVSTT